MSEEFVSKFIFDWVATDILYEIELVPILNTFKWVCEKSNSGSTTFLWTIEDKKKRWKWRNDSLAVIA